LQKFINHAVLLKEKLQGTKFLADWLDTFIDSYNEAYEKKISSKNKSVFALLPNRISEDIPDDLYLRLLRIIDFVSGMTDSFAVFALQKNKRYLFCLAGE